MSRTLIITLFITFSSITQAIPRIGWTYQNVNHNTRRNECVRKILGNCVEWREVINRRTKYAWRDFEKTVVKEAMNRLGQRIGTTRVHDCIKKWVRKYRGPGPSGHMQHAAWDDFHALARANNWPHINIRAWRADRYSGQATIERRAWGTSTGLHWRGALTIELNLNELTRTQNNFGFSSAADDFAGTIMHEILHQMKHDHPTNDYSQGHFITVAGDCIASNGAGARNAGGFSLRGNNGRTRRWFQPK